MVKESGQQPRTPEQRRRMELDEPSEQPRDDRSETTDVKIQSLVSSAEEISSASEEPLKPARPTSSPRAQGEFTREGTSPFGTSPPEEGGELGGRVTMSADGRQEVIQRRALAWLHQIAEIQGAAVVLIPLGGMMSAFRALVINGQMCFGVEVHERPFLDVEFDRASPTLAQRLFGPHRQAGALKDAARGWTERCLARADVPLVPEERATILAQLWRVLERSARFCQGKLHEHLQVEPVVVPASLDPLRFDAVEIFTAGRARDRQDRASRHFDALQHLAQEAWLMERARCEAGRPLDALLRASRLPTEDELSALCALYARARALPFAEQAPRALILSDGERALSVHLGERHVSIVSTVASRLGLIAAQEALL